MVILVLLKSPVMMADRRIQTRVGAWAIWLSALLLPAMQGLGQDASTAGASPNREHDQQEEVRRWIDLLGSDSYAMRLRAQSEIRRLGLMPLDLLHEASNSDDKEISLAARQLISSLDISWAFDSDPAIVREVLEDYGVRRNEADRRTQINRLAQLPDRVGLAALCRLVRFETSLRLSREAALLVMQQPPEIDGMGPALAVQVIRGELGTNQRPGSVWLRAYAEDLRHNEYDALGWQNLIAAERRLLDHHRSQQTDVDAVLELIRVCAVRASAADDREEAVRLAVEALELVPPKSSAVLEAAHWALDHDLNDVIKVFYQRQTRLFDRDPLLLYARAEASLVEGDIEQAEQLAQKARQIRALPPLDSEAGQQLRPEQKDALAHKHQVVAVALQKRGRFDWAIREFRHIVDSLPVDTTVSATTRWKLSDLYAKLLRHQDVLDILSPLYDRLQRDNELERRLRGESVSARPMQIRLLWHRGLRAAEQGQIEQAQRALTEAFHLSGKNSDILIAMYRLEADQKWRATVQREVEKLTALLEERIRIEERNYRESSNPLANANLAEALNEFAWLVSNTFGDQPRALQYSLRSLKLQPDDPMLLDTCGRCYYALGDLENALRKQTRAAKLAPEQPDVQRQWAEFLAARDAVPKSDDPAAPSKNGRYAP